MDRDSIARRETPPLGRAIARVRATEDKGQAGGRPAVGDSPVVLMLKDAKEWMGTEILGAKQAVSSSAQP